MTKLEAGSIGWVDLTVEDAARVKDFYCEVVGWKAAPVPVDNYQDFCVGTEPESAPAAGICHARGENAGLPAQWLIYIVVSDLEDSLRKCKAGGGTVLTSPRTAGGGRMAVIKDPGGAVCGLYEVADSPD